MLQPGFLDQVVWLRPRRGNAYWADPFCWPARNQILCEEVALDGGPGIIVGLAADGLGGWRRDEVLLADQLHRSYPYTFTESSTTYLISECLEDQRLAIYRLQDDGWMHPVSVVTPFPVADPTLFRHNSEYWVAGSDPTIGLHDNLCLFHAKALEGPWRPHRRNPVKIDIGSSRPAGTPFYVGDHLYRPAQDCAGAYGAAIVINRLIRLTEDDFTEQMVTRLSPDPRGVLPHGLHTVASFGTRTLLDGKRMVPHPRLVLRRIKKRVTQRWRGGGR